MLTRDYATGIIYKPAIQTLSRCIPCLIGKTPQALFAHNARRASKVCKLIHIDTCCPFPTLTPWKEAYFTTFLDDASNFGSITLLISRDAAYATWQKVKASWMLKYGRSLHSPTYSGWILVRIPNSNQNFWNLVFVFWL